MVTVKIYHNVTVGPSGRPVGMLDGYLPGASLTHVATFTTPLPAGDEHNVMAICNEAFHLLNVGDDPSLGTPDERAVAYRAARNRSLSVGDVVAVGEVFVAVAAYGWKPVDIRPAQIVEYGTYGTTPLRPVSA